MSESSIKGVFFSSLRGGSLLDRVSLKADNSALTEIQSDVDHLIGDAMTAVADEKRIASLFGAGLVGRLIRFGTVAALGKFLAPWMARGASFLSSLAGESAVFASLERSFIREGAVSQPFTEAWAASAISLGSIQFLGGVAHGQNVIVEHLLIDAGMVVGHHGGYALGVTEKPRGSLIQQIIEAEGMNLSLKGSLGLLHLFSPQISYPDRPIDFQKGSEKFSFGPPADLAVVGGFRWSAGPGSGESRGLMESRAVFMSSGEKDGEGGLFEKKHQAEQFKKEGRRLWGEAADDLIELYASTSLYARRAFMRGARRFFSGKEGEEKNNPHKIISSAAALEAALRDHPFRYREQIEADVHRLLETLQRVSALGEQMEGMGWVTAEENWKRFFSSEDDLLFKRLGRAGAMAEFLSETANPHRFLKDVAEKILGHQGLETLVSEALRERDPSKDFDFMSVGHGVGGGIAAKEAFREKSKTGAVVEYAGRIRGLSPISPRRFDYKKFQALVEQFSSPPVIHKILNQEDLKVWISVFVPAIVVACDGNYSRVTKSLASYQRELIRLSPSAFHVSPVLAWWLCRAIDGGGDPLSWSSEFPMNLTNPDWAGFDISVLNHWVLSKKALGEKFGQEFTSMPQETLALAHALVAFLRHPYDPKAAMRLALRAPEKVREDALNLTGALLGSFHGSGIFSPRRLADWKKTTRHPS